MPGILNLRLRYFQDSTPAGVPCREENFQRREIHMPLPVDETAFVLVDLWNLHFCESWLERAKKVTVEAVVPALEAARRAGLTVIHAPCPEVARQYPQHLARHRPPPQPPHPIWPPAEFRHRQGQYTVFRGPRDQPPGIDLHWAPLAPKLAMSPAIRVLQEDEVVATGQQLHEWLAQRRILHLIYCGFATNWCIMHRDYGVRAMRNRGYNVILLRDATTGVEYPDTLLDLLLAHIGRLRWVSVSPWADRELAAGKLGDRYVYVYKPNPSRICSPTPDYEGAEKEMRETLEMAQGCNVCLIMKDTHTFHHQPERLTRWTDIAQRVVAEMA